MGFLSVLGMAHKLVEQRVSPGDIAVDATCGNGVDTLFLAGLAGTRGAVYAFDIQQEALDRTQARLDGALNAGGAAQGPLCRLVLASHADMARHIPAEAHGRLAAVMFNLGYLPGADMTVITQPRSTLEALEAAISLLRPGGIVTAVLYPGHEGGTAEVAAVTEWAAALPQATGQALLYRMVQKAEAPFLLAVEKKKPL